MSARGALSWPCMELDQQWRQQWRPVPAPHGTIGSQHGTFADLTYLSHDIPLTKSAGMLAQAFSGFGNQ